MYTEMAIHAMHKPPCLHVFLMQCLLSKGVLVFYCSAKPNDSLKLMLVGLQKMGKTTLLAHLRECNEATSPATTFTQRVGREEPTTRSGGSRKNKGGG